MVGVGFGFAFFENDYSYVVSERAAHVAVLLNVHIGAAVEPVGDRGAGYAYEPTDVCFALAVVAQ